jgi:hypothetical protein
MEYLIVGGGFLVAYLVIHGIMSRLESGETTVEYLLQLGDEQGWPRPDSGSTPQAMFVFKHPGGEVTLGFKHSQKSRGLCVGHVLRDFPSVTITTNSFDPVGLTTRDEAMGDEYFDDKHKLVGDEIELTALH